MPCVDHDRSFSSRCHSLFPRCAQNPETTASELRKAIETFETSYQNHLEEMYVNMHRNTFKNMRRFLPLNKVKFQWNSAAHSLANEVTNK
jgi:uncharacterized protein YpuA (DUF1002 family)